MKQRLLNKVKKIFSRKAIVLMYHRVAEPESDVWELAVSPERFEQHLQLLKKMGNVVPLQQLARSINSYHLPQNCISITFDDGYIDNFEIAKPLLEKYKIPATFFIASGKIENESEFWWDELERIFLFSERLPVTFSLTIGECVFDVDLKPEAYLTEEIACKHRSWKACMEDPPTARAGLFYKVWEQMRPLPFTEQEQCLQMIRSWVNLPLSARSEYRSMSAAELRLLASNNLFTIGAHTVTHPSLASHDVNVQRKELSENRDQLKEIINQEIGLVAYPYGSYNEKTLQVVSDLGFYAGFTTEEKIIKSKSPMYTLGRFQVKNLTGDELKRQLEFWKLQ
jgi:peptidoglycan/xylan/chitin deacetylase (PgdA/CDA1 family)